MRSLTSSEVAALIPQDWHVTASTVEDIISFGQSTIREMVCSWRRSGSIITSQINGVDKQLAALCGDESNVREGLTREHDRLIEEGRVIDKKVKFLLSLEGREE